jgi:hypothetical protein
MTASAALAPLVVTTMVALSAPDFLERQREVFGVRLLRVGHGIEIHRADVAFRGVGVGLDPQRRQ